MVSRRFWATLLLITPVAFLGAVIAGRGSRRRSARATLIREPVWPPGLGLADWARIEGRPTAEKQYRYAQIRADDTDRIAAWLAVPGHFPADTDWAWRAYVQLAAFLVRHTDRLRLIHLKNGLEACGRGVAFTNLAEVIRAALDGMDGNEIGMLEALHTHVKVAMDPTLAELILAILSRYRQRAGGDAIVPSRVSKLQLQIQEILRIDPNIWPGNFPLNPLTR